MPVLLEKTYQLPELPQVARECLNLINNPPQETFILSLIGDLGAGKTAFTRGMLREMGLPFSMPVQSPTFTYFNEYQIKGKLYLHMDLYRCDGSLDFLDLLGKDISAYFGFFIEWYEHQPNLEQELGPPTHILTLQQGEDKDSNDCRYLKLKCPSC